MGSQIATIDSLSRTVSPLNYMHVANSGVRSIDYIGSENGARAPSFGNIEVEGIH